MKQPFSKLISNPGIFNSTIIIMKWELKTVVIKARISFFYVLLFNLLFIYVFCFLLSVNTVLSSLFFIIKDFQYYGEYFICSKQVSSI